MALWGDQLANQWAFSSPYPFEKMEVQGHDRLFLSRALQSLTRDELLELYDAEIESAKQCFNEGGDFTCDAWREKLPHIYGSYSEDEPFFTKKKFVGELQDDTTNHKKG